MRRAIKTTKFKKTRFYFKDCYICREVAKADKRGIGLNTDELRKVFSKAGKMKAIKPLW